jgi:hypothetical protein
MNENDPDRMTKSTKQSIAYRQGIDDARQLNSGKAIRPTNFQTEDERESYVFGRRHGGSPTTADLPAEDRPPRRRRGR